MATSRSPAAPPRRSFALTGPSVALDPRVNAVRRDLADIRLADQVFAPHYAAPMAMSVLHPVALRASSDHGAPELAMLSTGETFEVLELGRECAWGVAPAHALVGYVAASALSPAETRPAEKRKPR